MTTARDYPIPNDKPIDRTAANTTLKGVHYQPEIRPSDTQVWDTPPPTLSVRSDQKNFIGTRHGRVTIVGYLGNKKQGGNTLHRWLGRCSCGKYVVRKHETWRKRDGSHPDMCPYCASAEQKKQNYVEVERLRQITIAKVERGEPTTLSERKRVGRWLREFEAKNTLPVSNQSPTYDKLA